MKKCVCFIVLMLASFMLCCNIADAQSTWTSGPYSNYANISQKLSISGATSLIVTVTGKTELNCDFVYIYNSSGSEIKKLSGSIKEWFTISGSFITVKLTSDKSTTANGVTVSVINASSSSAMPPANYDSGWLYLEKGGKYENLPHSLGVLPRLAIVWVASDKTGTDMKMADFFSEWNGAVNVSYGVRISKFTTNSYNIVGGSGGTMGIANPNAYVRVYMWK